MSGFNVNINGSWYNAIGMWIYTNGAWKKVSSASIFTSGVWKSISVPDIVPPSDVTGLQVSNVTCTSVVLSWDAANDNVAVDGYEIYTNGTYLTYTTNLTYTVASLNSNTAYTFGIKAKDTSGNTSVNITTINVNTLIEPDVAINATDFTISSNSGSVTSGSTTLTYTYHIDNGVGATAQPITTVLNLNGTQIDSKTDYAKDGDTVSSSFTLQNAAACGDNYTIQLTV